MEARPGQSGTIGQSITRACILGTEGFLIERRSLYTTRGVGTRRNNGEPIVVIAATDDFGGIYEPESCPWWEPDQLRRAGMKVDFQEMDFGTVVRCRASQAAPDKGVGTSSSH